MDRKKIKAEIEQIDVLLKAMINIEKQIPSFCLRDTFREKMESAIELLEHIVAFLEHRFPNSDSMYIGEKQRYLSLVLDDINEMKKEMKIGANQTMAFMNEFNADVFRKPLLSRPLFKFVKKSKIFYDYESHVQASFHIAYPFNALEFDRSKPCLKAAELSPFFVKKGRDL